MKSRREEEPLTSGEMAATCNVARSTVIYWSNKGIAKSFTTSNRTRLFPIKENARLIGDNPIRRIDKARSYASSVVDKDGARVAQIFRLLNEGVPRVEIVTRLDVHYATVEDAFIQWLKWCKVCILSERNMIDIANLLGVTPRRDPDELVVAARKRKAEKRLKRVKCRRCKKCRPTTCGRCIAEMLAVVENRGRFELGGPPKMAPFPSPMPKEQRDDDDDDDDDEVNG